MRRLAILSLLMGALVSDAGAAALVVVAHPALPATDVRMEELSRIFLGRLQRLGGLPVNPVNKEAGSPERALFDKRVHRMDDTAMKEHWLAARIKGEGQPPRSFQSDAAVLRYVSTVAGAIGYVSFPLTAEGVKPLSINGVPATEQTVAGGSYPLRGP
ncbi:MAG: hypothetical protein HY816_02485 [Candidatus Wallbacteria bacterium]|nr:hypothetical protein [Candidatus Wallbacteria bacterium]